MRMYVGKRGKGYGSGWDNKIPVVTLVEQGGRAKSTVLQRSVGAAMVVVDNVTPDATVVTDESGLYSDLANYVAKHATVNHSRKEWVRGGFTTNTVEGFFGQVRRSITGTHHRVTNKHVARYMAEYDFRYSTRKSTDSERLRMLLEQVGDKRLPYDVLKAEGA